MKNIMLLAFVVSTIFLQAQNIPGKPSFHFKNPNSILPGRIFGTERETGHRIQDVSNNNGDNRASGLSSIQIIDSLIFWQWDTVSNNWEYLQKISDLTYNDVNVPKTYTSYEWDEEWIPATRYVVEFDSHNNASSEIEQTWDEFGWENNYRTLSNYNASNQITDFTIQVWDGSTWINNTRFTYTYDEHDHIISFVTQHFQLMEWVNESKQISTYDNNQNQLSFTFQSWNGVEWVNDGQYLYSYDEQNHLTKNLYQQWDGFDWQNVIQYLFMYSGSGLLSSELSQYWIGSVWEDFARFSFTYNAQDQLINQLVETWAANQWINADYYTYAYDANGKDLSELREVWNGFEWIHSEESAFAYQDTFLVSEVFKYFNESGTALMYGDSSYYYFHEITGTESPEDKNIDIVVYPNPGNGMVTLNSNKLINSVQAFNLQGQSVYSKQDLSGQNTYEIDLSCASKGIYFINIYTETHLYTRRIVVQ